MSCFSCFVSADEAEPKPAVKQKPTPQAQKPAAKADGQASRQQPSPRTNVQPSKLSADPFKAEADAQAIRQARIAATSPNTPTKLPNAPPQSNGTPAYMAIPPLDSPLNGRRKASKGRPVPVPERKSTSDRLASELPPLKDSQAQASPPSFKGFLTETDKLRNAAVLNTADIWKPKLSDMQQHPSPLATRSGSEDGRQTEAESRSSALPGSAGQHPAYIPAANGLERGSKSSSQDLARLGRENQQSARSKPPSPVPSRSGSITDDLTQPTIGGSDQYRPPFRPIPNRGNSLNNESPPQETESRGLRRTVSGNPADQGLAGGELYAFVSQLGVGSTGVTRLMKDKRTGELVAAKWVPHTAGEMLSVQVEREILNHRRLLHNNVVRFREVFATDDHLVIVTDYATAGSLSSHVEVEGAISEQKAKDFFRQLVDGMTYCHRLGIVHRNLRLEKLLLDGQPGYPVLKISGFAYSKAPALDSAPKSIVGGGPTYMAPEMLLASREGSSYDGRALDVWSIGVCLFTILTGSLPFKDPNEPGILSRKLMQRIVNCIFEFPGHARLSPEARDLVSKILVPDPKKRLDSYSLSSHPWLAGTTLQKSAPVIISKQSETDISQVMERARKRKEARMAAQRATARHNGAFNEDLLDE